MSVSIKSNNSDEQKIILKRFSTRLFAAIYNVSNTIEIALDRSSLTTDYKIYDVIKNEFFHLVCDQIKEEVSFCYTIDIYLLSRIAEFLLKYEHPDPDVASKIQNELTELNNILTEYNETVSYDLKEHKYIFK